MRRNDLPNLLLGASVLLNALSLALATMQLASSELPEILHSIMLSALPAALAVFVAGIGLTLRWRDRFPTKPVAGPVLAIVYLLSCIAVFVIFFMIAHRQD